MFSNEKEDHCNEILKLSDQLKEVQNKLKLFGYEENVRQVEKSKEYGGACSRAVSNRFLSNSVVIKQFFLIH